MIRRNMTKNFRGTVLAGFCASVLALLFAFAAGAQSPAAPAPVHRSAAGSAAVKQIDALGLKKLLKPAEKPLLVNFWATWCDPCRDEFPDLVKIDNEYRGKIDFVTVTLDEPSEINRGVPKFLAEMKAEMPTYLLKTPDETVAIAAVAKDWQGGLPFTILYDKSGAIAYFRQGKIRLETVKTEMDKLLNTPAGK